MKRIYERLFKDHLDSNRQMVFISGPRQVGKTTLAESVLPDAVRLNYDKAADARIIAAGADKVAEFADLANPSNTKRGILFDELHKFPNWKRFLKGFFDVYAGNRRLKVAVTGWIRHSASHRASRRRTGNHGAQKSMPGLYRGRGSVVDCAAF